MRPCDPMPPIVAVPACTRTLNDHGFHIAGDKYLRAVAEGAGALPIVIPALPDTVDLDRLLDRVDGVLLTGSLSNVEPHHYGGAASALGTLHDPPRDAVTLPLVLRALERDLPVLAICRGHQELNVALGGTLHQRVHEVTGLMDHRAPPDLPTDVRYGPRHPIALAGGGLLQDMGRGARAGGSPIRWGAGAAAPWHSGCPRGLPHPGRNRLCD